MAGRRDFLINASTGLFPAALGLAGLGAATRYSNGLIGQIDLQSISTSLIFTAAAVLAIDLGFYVAKFVFARDRVIEDLSMATSANMLAPGFMAAMVVGGSGVLGPQCGELLWAAATIGHLLLLIAFVGAWFRRDYRPEELNPTWFLPGAGIMTSSLTWPDFGPVELPYFTLAVGAMLWVMLLPPIFRRMIVDPSVEPKLRPTLFIIAAPFGLMAGSQLTLFPGIPPVIPTLFLFAGVFLILVLISQTRFLNQAGATLTWWSPTFPIAVIASGLFRVSPSQASVTVVLAMGLLVFACLTTVFAIIATLHTAWNELRPSVKQTPKDG